MGKRKRTAAEKRAELSKIKGKAFDQAYVDNEVAYHKQVNDALATLLIHSERENMGSVNCAGARRGRVLADDAAIARFEFANDRRREFAAARE